MRQSLAGTTGSCDVSAEGSDLARVDSNSLTAVNYHGLGCQRVAEFFTHAASFHGVSDSLWRHGAVSRSVKEDIQKREPEMDSDGQ